MAINKTKRPPSQFTSLSDLLDKYDLDNQGKYITKEFQDYGYRLAMELNDKKHVGLYIKLAKTIDRSILEAALRFVKDAHNARNKARLFMWKLKQMRKAT